MEVTHATSAFFLYFLRALSQLSFILLPSKCVFLIGRSGEKDKGRAAITELDIITKQNKGQREKEEMTVQRFTTTKTY